MQVPVRNARTIAVSDAAAQAGECVRRARQHVGAVLVAVVGPVVLLVTVVVPDGVPR